ncbi:MAG: CHAT domain-containing protein, partial [Cyanobacteria bacterium J06592_8]
MIVIKVIVFWDQGTNRFRVRLTQSDGQINSLDGYLPALPDHLRPLQSQDKNPSSYHQWRSSYHQFEAVRRAAKTRINPQQIITDFEAREISSQHKQSVIESLNQWLNSHDRDWQPIRDELIAVLSHLQKSRQEVRLFLDTEDLQLRRLPWQEWDLLQTRFPQAEVAIRLQTSRRRIQPIHPDSQVKVLAVIGKSDGINTQFYLEVVKGLTLKNADVTVLEQPTREQLSQVLRQEDGYHIFLFAGHSSSHPEGSIGWIELNDRDSISIEEFKSSFRKAIQHGLQLAIFNSCDGLGLANQLAELGLPRSIVMREPIPDEVAVKFLMYFFQEFTQNQSLFHSIHLSRERLIELGFEKSYPGVSWLPTLCVQEVTLSTPLNWNHFINRKARYKAWLKPLSITPSLAIIAIFASILYHLISRTPNPPTPTLNNQLSSGEKLLV